MTNFQSVYDVLCASASEWPDHAFLNVLPETAQHYSIEAGEISYQQMLALTQKRFDAFKQAGIGDGHRIGVLVENRPVFYEIWF